MRISVFKLYEECISEDVSPGIFITDFESKLSIISSIRRDMRNVLGGTSGGQAISDSRNGITHLPAKALNFVIHWIDASGD